jgi:hypothetical protein
MTPPRIHSLDDLLVVRMKCSTRIIVYVNVFWTQADLGALDGSVVSVASWTSANEHLSLPAEPSPPFGFMVLGFGACVLCCLATCYAQRPEEVR